MEKVMQVNRQQQFSINHSTDIAAARRAGIQISSDIGHDETVTGKLAIIITEAATNILKHAGSGSIVLGVSGPQDNLGIDVLALDKGPGITNLGHSMRDGVSTAGTPGNGLGAISRMSDCFDVYTASGKGAALYMHLSANPQMVTSKTIQIGAVCIPMPGEEECGDGWEAAEHEGIYTILVADGLGHGPEAAHAAEAAKETLRKRAGLTPARLMEAQHGALRPTRGAALAIASLSAVDTSFKFAGIGNVGVCVITADQCKHVVSHNGIVGHNMRKVQEFTHDFPSDALLMMYSDGLTRQWSLNDYPGLQACHPALVAGVLYRDFYRGRDDITVLVVKRKTRAIS
jgi:anti-sigma regulatory factor (Ser/Thr protein kinase)